MPFLSIHFPHLPTDRIHRLDRAKGNGGEAPDPLALWRKAGNAQILAAVDAAAAAKNLHPGMALAVARGIHPALRVIEADPDADAALLASIADWCRRFTPLAALDPPDSVILDVSGVAHLFGGEDALLHTVEEAFCAQGFCPRASLAPNAAAASAFARFGSPRRVGEGAALEKAVRNLPVAALRLDAPCARGLRDAGLQRVGDLLLRPRAPISARFGAAVFAKVDALRGLCRDPLSPRFESPPYLVERRFAEGLARRDAIAHVLRGLCEELCALLARHAEGARKILATFFRVDGAVRDIEAATSRPTRDPLSLLRLLEARLDAIGEDGLDTGYGFDVLRLSALAVEPLAPQQALTPPFETQQIDADDFAGLVDRLGARIGTRRVLRFDFADTHQPEGASFLRPAAQAAMGQGKMGEWPKAALPPRPIRLLEKPEAVDAIATVPDGPPLKFRWRRVMHHVVASEGPERIAAEWWKAHGPTRDYFRVEDAQGGRFWIFREGLFGRETNSPRWFMHGLFG